ncbi:CPBP family intramembrane glutamic endopeptidase [Agrilactobacillus composti]|nr:CPBP family intramembrane glutamic endopeptidase [Agrilactobacillus composti]
MIAFYDITQYGDDNTMTQRARILRIGLFLLSFGLIDYMYGSIFNRLIVSDTWFIVIYKVCGLVLVVILNRLITHQSFFWNLKISVGRTLLWLMAIGTLTLFAVYHPVNFINALSEAATAAIAEELMFRGVLFPQLLKLTFNPKRRFNSTLLAIGLCGLIFGLWHFINLMHQPFLVTLCQVIEVSGMGCLLTAVYLRSRSLTLPIALHFWLDFVIRLNKSSYVPVSSSQISVGTSIGHLCLYLAIALVIMPKKPILKYVQRFIPKLDF